MSHSRIPFILSEADLRSPILSRPITVLMIDDQPILAEGVKRILQDDPTILFHYCSDPRKALEEAYRIRPTVILQDLVMPEIDGLTLVEAFRKGPLTKDIPMIVLSSREEPEVKYKAFALGANDYMVKFPDRLEVLARVRYHSQAYILKLERDQAFQALQASQAALKAELEEANRYVQSLLPRPIHDAQLDADAVQISSTVLGGDAYGYHWIDPDHFAIYLLDVCGHGVGAALLSVSVLNVIRSCSLDDVDFKNPAQVLAGLNSAFDMEAQNQMYFTLWYGVYCSPTRQLRYSSGGHPPAVLVRAQGALVERLKTPGLVVGAMPGVPYTAKSTQIFPQDRLYVFSDGVYEVPFKEDDRMYSLEEFIESLGPKAPAGQSKVQWALKHVQQIQQEDHFEDDFSLLELTFK